MPSIVYILAGLAFLLMCYAYVGIYLDIDLVEETKKLYRRCVAVLNEGYTSIIDMYDPRVIESLKDLFKRTEKYTYWNPPREEQEETLDPDVKKSMDTAFGSLVKLMCDDTQQRIQQMEQEEQREQLNTWFQNNRVFACPFCGKQPNRCYKMYHNENVYRHYLECPDYNAKTNPLHLRVEATLEIDCFKEWNKQAEEIYEKVAPEDRPVSPIMKELMTWAENALGDDLEKELPVEDESIDTTICFNGKPLIEPEVMEILKERREWLDINGNKVLVVNQNHAIECQKIINALYKLGIITRNGTAIPCKEVKEDVANGEGA